MGSSERCKIHIAGLFYLITLLYLTTSIVKYIKRAVGDLMSLLKGLACVMFCYMCDQQPGDLNISEVELEKSTVSKVCKPFCLNFSANVFLITQTHCSHESIIVV